jgi:hypothetical protein
MTRRASLPRTPHRPAINHAARAPFFSFNVHFHFLRPMSLDLNSVDLTDLRRRVGELRRYL